MAVGIDCNNINAVEVKGSDKDNIQGNNFVPMNKIGFYRRMEVQC